MLVIYFKYNNVNLSIILNNIFRILRNSIYISWTHILKVIKKYTFFLFKLSTNWMGSSKLKQIKHNDLGFSFFLLNTMDKTLNFAKCYLKISNCMHVLCERPILFICISAERSLTNII